jgi:hypothetical protein
MYGVGVLIPEPLLEAYELLVFEMFRFKTKQLDDQALSFLRPLIGQDGFRLKAIHDIPFLGLEEIKPFQIREPREIPRANLPCQGECTWQPDGGDVVPTFLYLLEDQL